jgi:RNA recognition motif-containing protein
LIPSPPAKTTVRKKKVQEDDGVEGLSPESVRKRKTSLGSEDLDQKGSQTLANGATSKRKKPKRISSEIDEIASNDNGRKENDHDSGNTCVAAAAKNDGDETCDEVEHRTVFVGNLPLSMTRKKLTCIFSKCGTVESTRIRSVPVKGVKLPPESAGNQVNFLFFIGIR